MFILQHSDILHNIFQIALTRQRGLYKLNGFKKPIYRYNNQTSIDNFISINTYEVIYILYFKKGLWICYCYVNDKLIETSIIKMNTKLIKIDIGYAIFNSNIHGKGE